ncbi:MAG: GNAT family N-acetyltransferase [Planctomycetota bacterium]|jgi:ribosomal protein S18 acetylase RimI-like enzyme
MTEGVLPEGEHKGLATAQTRAFAGVDSAEVAELSRIVRTRPKDCIDPWPPISELEVLADAGARGKGSPRHPRVVESAAGLVAYGALDFSDDLKRAQLLGPIVHPAHRHKGFGRLLIEDLMEQARRAKQKRLRATVGGMNQAGRALLGSAGFKTLACNTVLRLGRPDRYGELHLEGVDVRQATYDDWEDVHEFVRKLVPRTEKQTRSVLKTSEYLVLLANQRRRVIGFAEVDLRQGNVATLEHLDGPPNMLHKGLGNLMLWESVRTAFQNPEVEFFDFVVVGNDSKVLSRYMDAGFERRHDLIVFEAKL